MTAAKVMKVRRMMRLSRRGERDHVSQLRCSQGALMLKHGLLVMVVLRQMKAHHGHHHGCQLLEATDYVSCRRRWTPYVGNLKG